MPSPGKSRATGCPIAFALDIFGDRWSLLIMRDLMIGRLETYSELLAADERIATNVLADRLVEMEAFGLIHKSRDPDNRRRNIYRVTEKGCDLIPVIMEMVRWSGKYDPNTIAPKRVLDRLKSDREGLIADLRARLTLAPPAKAKP